jgi:hypothetical protein
MRKWDPWVLVSREGEVSCIMPVGKSEERRAGQEGGGRREGERREEGW